MFGWSSFCPGTVFTIAAHDDGVVVVGAVGPVEFDVAEVGDADAEVGHDASLHELEVIITGRGKRGEFGQEAGQAE